MSENQKFNISLDKIKIKGADKDYIKNNIKDEVEKILNQIIVIMRELKRSKKTINAKEVMKELDDWSKSKRIKYNQYCISERAIKSDNNDCHGFDTISNEDAKIFNENRIQKIVDKVLKNKIFNKIVAFKEKVAKNKLEIRIPLEKIIGPFTYPYSYPLSYPLSYPFYSPVYSVVKKEPRNKLRLLSDMYGGLEIEEVDDNPSPQFNELSDMLKMSDAKDESKMDSPLKYVDFRMFKKQYEDYYIGKDGKLYGSMKVQVCKTEPGSKKLKCTESSRNLNDSDSDPNINTHGYNEELEKANKMLEMIDKHKDINTALDNMDNLLDYLEYYVVPLKTVIRAKEVYNKLVYG